MINFHNTASQTFESKAGRTDHCLF